MRYFRIYPWALQLFLFLAFWFTLCSCGFAIMLNIFPRVTGLSIAQLQNITPGAPAGILQAAILAQGMLSVFMFLLPAFLFAYLSHPSPSYYLGLRPPGKKIQWPLVAFVIIGALPALALLDGLMSNINFGPKIKELQAENDNMMNAFLNIPDFYSFMRGLLIMAIIPALGEEMFFRGVLMRFVKKRSRTMLAPILTSAALFALAHSNVYGLPSIFSAGILLAVIYYLTGSLWCSIFAHLLFNGLQVILSYAGSNNAAIKAFMSTNTVSYPLVIGSILVFCVSFYLLWKNRTPLAPNWTDDFAPGELPGFDFGEKNK